MSKLRLWGEGGIIKMVDEKFVFNAFGIYQIGRYLVRLEWAIATSNHIAQLVPFFEPFRIYEQVHSFEDIGKEAVNYHNMLSSSKDAVVSLELQNELRAAGTRWSALAQERLQDLYLVTPKCKIDPKHLMKGIKGFLREEHFSFLKRIEVIDLNEACNCILIGSATAAEHIALRAAESLLRRWYEHETDKKLRYETWGIVLNRLLKEYPEEKDRPKEIALLGYLKRRRDEVSHPQRVSRLIEAETTLMNVCSLIEGIQPVLTKGKGKKQIIKSRKKDSDLHHN